MGLSRDESQRPNRPQEHPSPAVPHWLIQSKLVIVCRSPPQVLRAYGRFLEGVLNDPWAASKYFA
jgi:hypothetical protein